jgi:hypothetical protein
VKPRITMGGAPAAIPPVSSAYSEPAHPTRSRRRTRSLRLRVACGITRVASRQPHDHRKPLCQKRLRLRASHASHALGGTLANCDSVPSRNSDTPKNDRSHVPTIWPVSSSNPRPCYLGCLQAAGQAPPRWSDHDSDGARTVKRRPRRVVHQPKALAGDLREPTYQPAERPPLAGSASEGSSRKPTRPARLVNRSSREP